MADCDVQCECAACQRGDCGNCDHIRRYDD
jgi:hypothetical protein